MISKRSHYPTVPFPFLAKFVIFFLSFFWLNQAKAQTTPNYPHAVIDQHRILQKKVKVENGDLAYLDLGTGEPILLVHGVPTNSWLYRHVIAELLEKGYRVIAPDLLGYGSSSKPRFVDAYDAQRQGKRLLTLMNHLGIEQWTQVCHDAGGIWTWEMMQQAPNRVKNLVILNTIVFEEGFNPPSTFKRGAWTRFYTNLYQSALGNKFMVNMTLNNGLEKTKLSKADRRGYSLPMREGGGMTLYNFFTSFEDISDNIKGYQKTIKDANVPILVIWGDQDDILQGSVQIPLLQKQFNVPNENIHRLKNAKHFIQEEEPKKIANWIADFVG